MRLPVLGCSILIAACTADGPRDAMTVSDSAGIQIVANDHTRPAWPRAARWQLAGNPGIQVGNLRGNPGHELYGVAHSTRLRDGGIAVANTGLGDIRLFDRLGYYVRTIGLGSDAAESAQPVQVDQLGGDSLLIVQRDLSLTLVDTAGRRISRSRLASPGEGLESPPLPLGIFHDGTLLFRVRHPRDSTATGVGRRQMRLLRYATDGRLLGSFGDFDEEAVLFEDRGGYIFGPTGAVAVADSTTWYSSGDHYELREIGFDGQTLRIVRLDRPEVPVLQADITAYRSNATRQVQNTPRASTFEATLEASQFADIFPALDQIIVDRVGNLWVRNYQWFDFGSGKGWSIFDADGRYLGEMTTPSILEIHDIGDDFVLGRMATGRGSEAVYIFRLEKPGAEAAGDGAVAPPGV